MLHCGRHRLLNAALDKGLGAVTVSTSARYHSCLEEAIHLGRDVSMLVRNGLW